MIHSIKKWYPPTKKGFSKQRTGYAIMPILGMYSLIITSLEVGKFKSFPEMISRY